MAAAHLSVVGLLVLVLIGLILVGGVVAVIALMVYVARRPAAAYSKNPNLQPCPDCGQFISMRAATCPHCGGPVKGA